MRPYLWPLWAVLLPFCAPKTPPPSREKAWAEVDAPEPYTSPLPPSSGAPSAMVSAEEIERLEDAIDAFSQKALRLRQSAKRAGPMSRAQLENWRQLLDAIDRFLESGISSQDSAELIRTRATIEFDLEADAQVYTSIPEELLEAILEHEADVGVRDKKIHRAAAEAKRHRPPPPRETGRPTRDKVFAERLSLPERLASAFAWPIKPVRVNSLFGKRFHPIFRRYRPHQGIDLKAKLGQSVTAVASGRIIRASMNGGHGLQVQIEHGGDITTSYSHLSKLMVKVGDEVKQGTEVGRAGSTGDSTGVHLHFEYREGGVAKDPLDVLPL